MNKTIPILLIVLMVSFVMLFTACDPGTQSPGIDDSTGTLNSAPTGSAGTGKTMLLGETISFDEAAASDSDASDSLTYQWSITSAPTGSTAAIANSTSLTGASFTPDVPGDYTAQLTVSDGEDSGSFTAELKVVGFAIGMNSNSGAAVIQNGVFSVLAPPPSTFGYYSVSYLRLKDSTVYCAGESNYGNLAAPAYQAVFWEGGSAFEVDNPTGANNYRAYMLEVDSAGTVHLINVDRDSEAGHVHWIEGSGYSDSSAINSDTPWDNYMFTAIDEVDGEIYQAGFGNSEIAGGFFLAENLTEIIHNTSFEPDPTNPENGFEPGGIVVSPSAPAASTEIYIYGSYWDGGDNPPAAGYTVNDGSWHTLPPMHINNTPEDIRFMLDPSNYILMTEAGGGQALSRDMIIEPVDTYAVFINDSYYDLETPYENDPDVDIIDLEYSYLEIIDGSVFVGGSFVYQNNSLEVSYNVAAIWRDGELVYEGFDDDPEDSDDYTYATLAYEAFDFE